MINPIRHLTTVADHQRPHAATGDTQSLEHRLDRLALICMAMWSLIQSDTNLTEDDLLARVKEIDLMDGAADGKITRQVAKCSQCDRPMSTRHTKCIYCGSGQLIASAFDTV